MSPEPLRVIIADDHLLVAQALQKLLTADFRVVAIVHDGRKLIGMAIELTPDIILVDINMPVLNGLHAGERIKRQLPQTKVIYVTVASDPELVSEAFARGADGFVAKTAAPSELLTAVRCALCGEALCFGRSPGSWINLRKYSN